MQPTVLLCIPARITTSTADIHNAACVAVVYSCAYHDCCTSQCCTRFFCVFLRVSRLALLRFTMQHVVLLCIPARIATRTTVLHNAALASVVYSCAYHESHCLTMQHVVLLCIPARITSSTAALHNAAQRSSRHCAVVQIVTTDCWFSASNDVSVISTKACDIKVP